MITADRFEGCLLGLALGDALGAPFEGGPVERLLWRLIGTIAQGHMRWTDDTQMTCESLVTKGEIDADDLAIRFARSYRWSRGYGPGTAKLLKRIARGVHWRDANRAIYPDGSYGNGAAMRAPVVGLFYADRPKQLTEAARLSAGITHAHPLAIEGAVLVATATALALATREPTEILHGAAASCKLQPFTTRLGLAASWLRASTEATPEPTEVRKRLGNGIAASESCVTALYLAVRFISEPFEDMQAFVASCGGDADTIGAMAGAVWGAANGVSRLPGPELQRLEHRDGLSAVAAALHARQRDLSAALTARIEREGTG
jgi:poly(ADP-ribose) glycohydrolase ARH3